MAKPKTKPQIPGATPPTTPSFEQLQAAKIFEIAKVQDNLVIATQADFDALADDKREHYLGLYARFLKAPADPTPEQIQAGADEVIDAKLAVSKEGHALLPNGDIDPSKLDRPVLTKDGWVCPAGPNAKKG